MDTDISLVVDMVTGFIMIMFSILGRRFFVSMDKLADADTKLNDRINELAINAVSRNELTSSMNRILDRIDKLEERMFKG